MYKIAFKLAGSDWEASTEPIEGYRYTKSYKKHSIKLLDKWHSKDIKESQHLCSFWRAIQATIVEDLMSYFKEDIFKNHLRRHGALVAQFMMQIEEHIPDKEYPTYLNIGPANYTILIDNDYCYKKELYGESNSNLAEIYISNYDPEDEVHYDYWATIQTLIHESLHAVNYELDLHDTEWDSENTVNVMSCFLTEVLRSKLTVKRTTDATNPKNTKVKQGEVL